METKDPASPSHHRICEILSGDSYVKNHLFDDYATTLQAPGFHATWLSGLNALAIGLDIKPWMAVFIQCGC